MNSEAIDHLINIVRKMTEKEVCNALYRDCLTGAWNRRAFEATSSPFVGIVDMDSLKYLNDSYGHRVGDSALIELAGVLVEEFGGEDVYRISGDEFAVRGHDISFGEHFYRARRRYDRFSFGVGYCLESADEYLKCDKEVRQRLGLRAPRGERPPWLD